MKYLTLVLLFISLISCKTQDNRLRQHQLIKEQSNEIFNDLVQIRRDIHIHPEIAGQEKRTSKIIEKYLLNLGLEVKTNIGGYGVVGILNGDKEGKKIAWRADMDAIKNNNTDKADFKSQNDGIAHMCGHDVHTTIGLGIANVLSNLKEDINGTVYFIFQPSEETFKGAKAMVDDGLFDEINPDEIYGLHIFPSEIGIVSTKPKELFAYEKTVKVIFERGIDRDELKGFLQKKMREFVRNKPNSSPWSLDHITDPKLGLENPETIYQDYFILLPDIWTKESEGTISFESTFFETNEDKLDSILSQINNHILNSKYKDSFLSISYSRGNPTVVNDPELTENALQTIDNLYKNNMIKPMYGQVPYFNEDFIYFQQKTPGVMFLLGGSNAEKGLIAMPHSPEFAVDEEAIKVGVKYFSSLILERTNNK